MVRVEKSTLLLVSLIRSTRFMVMIPPMGVTDVIGAITGGSLSQPGVAMVAVTGVRALSQVPSLMAT